MQSSIGVRRAVRLARGGLERIADGKGACIQVWDGALWITQEGDPRDYYVAAGEAFRIAREGVTLIYAMERAVVAVTAPARAPSWLARLWANSYARYSKPTTAAL